MVGISDDIRTALGDVVGPAQVLGANQIAMLDPGACPGNLDADLAVRPGNAQEVSEILKVCASTGVPLIPHGGRTGLAGAARSSSGQIVLLSENLATPLDIDPVELF